MTNDFLNNILEEKQRIDSIYNQNLIDLAFHLNNYAFSSFNTQIETSTKTLSFSSTNYLFCMNEKSNFFDLGKISFSFSTQNFSDEPEFIKIIKPTSIKLNIQSEKLRPEDVLNLIKTSKNLEILPIHLFENTPDFISKIIDTFGKNSNETPNWKSFGLLSPNLGQYSQKKEILLHTSLVKVLSDNLVQDWLKKVNSKNSVPQIFTDMEENMQKLFLKHNLDMNLGIGNTINKKPKI